MMSWAALAAILGAIWRFWDGRGADSPILPAPGWVRLIVCFALALGCLWPLGWLWAVPVAGAWTAMWTPRQKNREEFDDMAFRWALPIGAAFGLLLTLATGSPKPLAIMGAAGMSVAAFVWASTKLRDLNCASPDTKWTARQSSTSRPARWPSRRWP